MYNHQPENYACPLCQIIRGEDTARSGQAADIIYRDDFVLALIAGKWWRSNPGHVIIIPNEHFENIYDLPAEISHKIVDLSKAVALGVKQAYGCDGISTRQHNEPAGNQDVWHYHVHVFPRYEGDNLYLRTEDTFWPAAEEKLPYADKLRAYFKEHPYAT